MKSRAPTPAGQPVAASLIASTTQAPGEQPQALAKVVSQVVARARAFAEPLIATELLDTAENTLAHADAVAAILNTIGGSEAMQAASYLVYACDHLNKPQEVIAKAFGDNFATLAIETTKLVQVQRQARAKLASVNRSERGLATPIPMAQTAATQTESVRKMLLAFSKDLRVVMLRLASRLQTLRHFAASKLPVPPGLAAESLQVFAPLANRLGIWEIKWELEDLSFRFMEPDTYKQVAKLLDEKRTGREAFVQQLRARIEQELKAEGIASTVKGRPKHIYSIVKKMRGKSLGFEQVYDIRALRIVVASIPDCYAALGWVHSRFQPVAGEFDDYIAKPKANGYQSLHTVVRDASLQAIEVQIRTQAMHDHAEHGVAAHWAYKEAGVKGYAGVSASGEYDARLRCCANCWRGSAICRVPQRGRTRGRKRDWKGGRTRSRTQGNRSRSLLTTASMCSRPMPRLWNWRKVPRRWTLPTACTPTWATAAVARASTASWCRSTRRSKTARRWR